jgi:60 kDa SS-A/Ro ribonucleoprotein
MTYKAVVEGVRGAFTKDEQFEVPREVIEAIQDAMEVAVSNVPALSGNVVLCPDVSGSMSSGQITGFRKGSTTMVRCIDVAGLLAAVFLRRNSTARVLPFEGDVRQVALNPRDSIMTNATKLSAIRGGATNCSAPLALLNKERASVDFVVFVSDYESWSGHYGASRGTPMMEQWAILKARNPNAKLVCIDLTPQTMTQAPDREDILNVGGFSDTVFKVVDAFSQGSKDHWVETIEKVEL